jgi:predicted transposase YbfD/YdcC
LDSAKKRFNDKCFIKRDRLPAGQSPQVNGERDGKLQSETCYFLSSAKHGARTFTSAIRAQWGVESRLHWVLDVVFHDDLARLRAGFSAHNMAIV